MRVLIVDDEPLAADWLGQCLAALPDVTVVGSAGDGDEALEKIEALRPDLVLLDIQMPGRNGLAVARALANRPRPEVVFITAYAAFAPDAFEVEAADYLLKPVRPDRLADALKRAARRLRLHAIDDHGSTPGGAAPSGGIPPDSRYESVLWIRERDGSVRVDAGDIRRIEAERDYALIHTRTRTHILRITMGELERKLDPAVITRVHRSAFVRLDTVRRVERSGRNMMRLQTEDGAIVDVGVSYGKRVTALLGLYADARRTG